VQLYCGASGAVTGVLYSAILRLNMMLGLFFIEPIPTYLFGILARYDLFAHARQE
jgi:hypothetical protein